MIRSSTGGSQAPYQTPFGIDDGDGAAGADSQAIGLGARDAALVGEPEREQPRLQVVPGDDRTLAIATLRLRLVATEEDVAARGGHADDLSLLPLGLEHVGRQRRPCGVGHQYRTAPVTRTQ